MSVTYTRHGALTLSGLIRFLEKIQDERRNETVRLLDAETYAGAMAAMQGQELRPPLHSISITVEGPENS